MDTKKLSNQWSVIGIQKPATGADVNTSMTLRKNNADKRRIL